MMLLAKESGVVDGKGIDEHFPFVRQRVACQIIKVLLY